MRPDSSYWIKQLQLTEHVEGGSFREVYRSELTIPRSSLPAFLSGGPQRLYKYLFFIGPGTVLGVSPHCGG
ncbi:cupin domain-containing protein [Puia sp. P3]|uniref:cupin domain-containing protein n=1 Tax=Puia sp. P3 TaxID=3423952 RepID=UPI003D6727C9